MTLSEVCIKRPVLAWVLTLVVVLLGVVGFSRLSLQQYPKFEKASLSVETILPGAGPEIVEAQVTRVIEEGLSGIEGIETITSVSSVENSEISLELTGERDTDAILNDIRDRLSKVKDQLDDATQEPQIKRSKINEKPIMSLALTSDEKTPSELGDFAIKDLQKELETVTGVSRVDVLGAGEYILHIYLDPVKLAAFNLTVSEVLQSLKRQSIEKPAGKIISKDREYLVTTVASIDTPEEYNQTVVATRENALVYLKDIGYAEIDADDKKTRARFNGKPGITLTITKQTQANPIEVSKGVKKTIEEMKKRLPKDINIYISTDNSDYIKDSISKVYDGILEATLLVILVVFGFLRSLRASVIPLVAIPVSLIGSFFVMYLLGFSVNIFTLLALLLAVGLVVDDAIVVLENIHRHMEEGLNAFEASVKGIKEISFAVIAMTLTLAAVYAPISLAQGYTGKLLKEFSITLAVAVIISGFAALTLSPMMCARLLKHDKKSPPKTVTPDSNFSRFMATWQSGSWLDKIENLYEENLKKVFTVKNWIVLGSFGFFIFTFLLYKTLPSILLPKEGQKKISLDGNSALSATLEYTDRYVKQLDDFLATIPEIEKRSIQINNPTFDGTIQLYKDTKRPTQEVVDQIQEFTKTLPGLDVRVKEASGGGFDSSGLVEFVVYGNRTYDEVKNAGSDMNQRIYASGIVYPKGGIRGELSKETQDYVVIIQRDLVSSLNIEPATIAETVDALIRGRKANMFKKDNKLYQVKLEVIDEARQTPNDITNLFIKAGDKEGTLVPLAELVKVESRIAPVEIHHYKRSRSISYTAFLKESVGVDKGIKVVSELSSDLPEGIALDFIGETKNLLKESQTMLFVLSMALIFIYLVLAAQFESWLSPVIIMLSVPLSFGGAIMTLSLIDKGSINLYSMVGFVTLIGLITKHGIMMVDFANVLRDEGNSPYEAILKASKLRLRPILMTTGAMILGVVPLILGTGAGFESRRQIGWTIFGGMSVGTLFTMFVLPVFYIVIPSTLLTIKQSLLNLLKKNDD